MSIWILTTGNSDIHLKKEPSWKPLYDKFKNNSSFKYNYFASPTKIETGHQTFFHSVPARILGLVYENQEVNYEQDLGFPLLDTFRKHFEENTQIKLSKVFIILTDQQGIFTQPIQRGNKFSPYWQDTCTLLPLFKWYFEKKFKLKYKEEFEFLTLEPTSGHGLDHWNEALTLVKEKFKNINNDEPSDTVYVSHQAGTPAISSAVQFLSLNKFQNVKFILSNQYYDTIYNQNTIAEEVKYSLGQSSKVENEKSIESQQESESNIDANNYIEKSIPQELSSDVSEYRRSIQIEKAKELIISGFPGAALNILNDVGQIKEETIFKLKKMINFFNLRRIDDVRTEDFLLNNASQRIVDSLDLISFFFAQNNYIQGITLLAATQETFLKVAILHEINKNQRLYNGVEIFKALEWDNEGLFLISDDELCQKFNVRRPAELETLKLRLLSQMNFSQYKSKYQICKENVIVNFKTNANNAMLEWIKQLRNDFESWNLLEWSCDYYKERELDLRNQFVHNLRGIKEEEAIKYLSGKPEDEPIYNNISDAYDNYVKNKFIQQINKLGLNYNSGNLQASLQSIADSLF